MKHYHLECIVCGKIIEDDSGMVLNCSCPGSSNGLLQTVYAKKQLELLPLPGIFKYSNWLPVNITSLDKFAESNIHPLSIQNEKLGTYIGLNNLTLIFNGYWPEKCAHYKTCTFKELEALTVLGRINQQEGETLVISSAGNTARAFYHYCTLYNIQVVLIVPKSGLSELWTTLPNSNSVSLITLDDNQDYTDANEIGERINEIRGFYIEGGVRNVARRDGLGTVLLAGVHETGSLPSHYFQAIGSGTGAIAIWEMSKRLRNDGRFGSCLPKLHLAQNKPFVPITNAWNNSKTVIKPLVGRKIKNQISKLYAPVLSNRNPPYSIKGGLYHALKDTNGQMYSISKANAESAANLFYKMYNTVLDPAAAVALASLIKAAQHKTITKDDHVYLNLTGGGINNLNKQKTRFIKPDAIIHNKDITQQKLSNLLKKTIQTKQKVKL